MKKRMIPLFLCAALLLSGCGLLQREYTRTSPHSATYYEGSRRDVLRAESYQDLVNDLLLLVGAHSESGTVWLYGSSAVPDASRMAQKACDEVLLETPLSGTLFTGYTRLYIPVAVSAPGCESGQIVRVKLGRYDGERVRAALC